MGRYAFTLVELAIVLVIIGLLVGGVLVGADLITSAKINATVSDLQSYTTAATTFRDKYNGIPGDLFLPKAQQAGLTVSAFNPGTWGEGDGDGILNNGVSGSGATLATLSGLGGENTLFWRQLSDAGLIPFKSSADGTSIDTTNFTGNSAVAISTLTPLIPQLRIRNTGFIHISSTTTTGGGGNYYLIGNFTGAGATTSVLSAVPVLTAREAQAIDQKLDDGYPATGKVISRIGAIQYNPNNGGAPVTTADTKCYNNSTAQGSYAVSVDDNLRCSLLVGAGF